MEIKVLEIILIGLCLFSVIPIIIFFKRRKTPTNVDMLLELYNNKMESNLEKLNQGNKKIDEIEQKILICKKKLNMKKFNQK